MDNTKPVVLVVLDGDSMTHTVVLGEVNVISIDYDATDGHEAASLLKSLEGLNSYSTHVLGVITKLNDIVKDDEGYQEYLADTASEDDDYDEDDDDSDDDDDNEDFEDFDDDDAYDDDDSDDEDHSDNQAQAAAFQPPVFDEAKEPEAEGDDKPELGDVDFKDGVE